MLQNVLILTIVVWVTVSQQAQGFLELRTVCSAKQRALSNLFVQIFLISFYFHYCYGNHSSCNKLWHNNLCWMRYWTVLRRLLLNSAAASLTHVHILKSAAASLTRVHILNSAAASLTRVHILNSAAASLTHVHILNSAAASLTHVHILTLTNKQCQLRQWITFVLKRWTVDKQMQDKGKMERKQKYLHVSKLVLLRTIKQTQLRTCQARSVSNSARLIQIFKVNFKHVSPSHIGTTDTMCCCINTGYWYYL